MLLRGLRSGEDDNILTLNGYLYPRITVILDYVTKASYGDQYLRTKLINCNRVYACDPPPYV